MARTISSCLGLLVGAAAATSACAGLSDPHISLIAAAGSAAGGIAGNFGTDVFKILYRDTAERWFEGRSGIDENHDVETALRLAQLKSLRVVLDRFDGAWRLDSERSNLTSSFSVGLKAFLDAEEKRDVASPVSDRSDAEQERVLRGAVLAALPDAFDEGLAARRADGDASAFQGSLRQLRAAVENAVLAEIAWRAGLGDAAVPDAFRAFFDGQEGPDAWFDLFLRDAAFRLKESPEFSRIWSAEQSAIAKAHGEVLAAISDDTRAIRASVDTLTRDLALTHAEKEKLAADLARVQAEYGSTVSLLSGFLASVVGGNVPTDQFAATLFRIAADWKRAGERLDAIGASRNLSPRLGALRDRAKAAYAEERIADFAAYLAEIEHEETRDLAKLEAYAREVASEVALRREGLIETKKAKLALARSLLRHEDAARLIADIVDLSHPEDERLAALWREQDGYYNEGGEKGLNASLEIAIAIARIGVLRAGGTENQGGWRNKLGNALWTLGAREGSTARLDEAVAAYRAALEERTRERVPLDWATTQNNLGIALQALGARESGTARLEEAVAAYRAALEERTRERAPLDWAMTQNNLGAALSILGERESGTARLEEAVAAYRAALEERTRERVPLDWAATRNNLGIALQTLGERESGTARLEQAVAAYCAALEERTRERVPLDWAMTQNNLGAALSILGERESGTARLEEAVAAYRAALEERTRERVPLYWAMTQNNIGFVLQTLGARESGTARLEEAVAAYRAALEEFTRERAPFYWEVTQSNLDRCLAIIEARRET